MKDIHWLQIFVLQSSNISNEYILERNVISSMRNVVVGSPLIEHAYYKLSKERSWRNFVYFGYNAKASVARNKIIRATTWRMISFIPIFQTIRLKWNDIEHDYSDVKREATNIHKDMCFLSLFTLFTTWLRFHQFKLKSINIKLKKEINIGIIQYKSCH